MEQENEMLLLAFQIISLAGEASSSFRTALRKFKSKEYTEAQDYLKLGETALSNAHKLQTEILVAEANHKKHDLPVTMVHAQDHLMLALLWHDLYFEFEELYNYVRSNNEER